MAGGPHGAVVMCVQCTGRAARIREGIENDSYRCDDCGGEFGIHWDEGPPTSPRWPPSPDELAEARRILILMGKLKEEP